MLCTCISSIFSARWSQTLFCTPTKRIIFTKRILQADFLQKLHGPSNRHSQATAAHEPNIPAVPLQMGGLPTILLILLATLLLALHIRRRNRIDPNNWTAIRTYIETQTGVALPESDALLALAPRETERLLSVACEHANLEADSDEKRKAILALAVERRERFGAGDEVVVAVIGALREGIEASPRR